MNSKSGARFSFPNLARAALALSIGSVSFHAAFAYPALSILIFVYFACLVDLTRAATLRGAFYSGLAMGLLIFAPKLTFFYTIFSMAAVPLWIILSLWHGLFTVTGAWARRVFGRTIFVIAVAVLWMGFEYFRSELYPLKFSWMAGGYAFAAQPNLLISFLGVYGAGFVMILVAAALDRTTVKHRLWGSVAAIAIFLCLLQTRPGPQEENKKFLEIAGMQLEFPAELEIPFKLDALKKKYPDASIYVLSEYTFDGPVPQRVLDWCRRNEKYLIVGGKDPAGENFYNTAFVISPKGEIVFKQVKAVPIQFFKDGLPAPEQRVWDSPWGKIGICVCYDLSYTRTVDALAKQGANLLIAPTMDVEEWGQTQHELHALIAPTRAAEYQIPIFRLASSGISQAVDKSGRVLASTPFPGPEKTLQSKLPMGNTPSLPLDRYLAPFCSFIAFGALVVAISGRKLGFDSRREVKRQEPVPCARCEHA